MVPTDRLLPDASLACQGPLSGYASSNTLAYSTGASMKKGRKKCFVAFEPDHHPRRGHHHRRHHHPVSPTGGSRGHR
jgi:hypothetical protein